MMTELYTYKLQEFVDIQMDGFDIKLPDETLALIMDLAQQVGSPTYIKTPVFNKVDRSTLSSSSNLNQGTDPFTSVTDHKRKRRNNRGMEQINDEDWHQIRHFQATQIEKKEGLDCEIDKLRSFLNKMTEKNYENQKQNIVDILTRLLEGLASHEEMMKVGNAIFEIASNNRFYSKLYADLYTGLIRDFEVMKSIFEANLESFMELFKKIEHANADENYDDYCRVNRDNERRKSLSSFFVNLALNGIIPKEKMVLLTKDLLHSVVVSISLENKKCEVDEMIENISILYNKAWFKRSEPSEPIKRSDKLCEQDKLCDKLCDKDKQSDSDDEEDEIIKQITTLAYCKSKNYPSLSNKSIFKCMDMIEM